MSSSSTGRDDRIETRNVYADSIIVLPATAGPSGEDPIQGATVDSTRSDTPTIFYRMPADSIDAGMSTEDGQDVLSTSVDNEIVMVSVYTPSDEPAVDADNRSQPETRVYRVGELVGMATFSNSPVDGSSHDRAAGPA